MDLITKTLMCGGYLVAQCSKYEHEPAAVPPGKYAKSRTGARKTTPIDALEVTLGMPPRYQSVMQKDRDSYKTEIFLVCDP